MKRTILFLTVLMLCAALFACAAKESEPAEPVVVSAPGECDVSLMLPLGVQSDTTKLLKGYTDGFVSGSGKLLTFTTETGNPDVALSSLFEDGTLCILAVREGKTTVTVTAVCETGESAVGRINVTVTNARRILVLALTGALLVILLIVFGQPTKKKPGPEAGPEEPKAEPTEAPETEEKPETGGEA